MRRRPAFWASGSAIFGSETTSVLIRGRAPCESSRKEVQVGELLRHLGNRDLKRMALKACRPDRRPQLVLAKMGRGHVAKLRYRHEQGTTYVAGLPLHPIALGRAVNGLPHAAKGSASRDFREELRPRRRSPDHMAG
jgi:hypothetical protein